VTEPIKTPYDLIPSTSRCATCSHCNADCHLLESQNVGDEIICPNCFHRVVISEDSIYNLPDAISIRHNRPVISREMAKNMPCPFPPWEGEEPEGVEVSRLQRLQNLDKLVEMIRRA